MAKITNREVSTIFATIGDMLEIKGESIHRILAYRRAAETVANLPRDLNVIFEEGTLTDLPGIGETLAEKIEELLTTGELSFYNKLADEIPPGVIEMLRVPGLGAKKVARFWKEANITNLDELKAAAQAGKLRYMSGMGAKSETVILEGIESLARRTDRMSIGDARPIALMMLERLLTIPGAQKGDVGGSLRRWRPTIGDIDLLIASNDAEPTMKAFVEQEEVARVLGHGPTKSSIELHTGTQVDLRIVPPERYGTLLAYFTGNKEHNVKMRELALKQGLSLNEHAFTPVKDGDEILCATEEEVYSTLGLPWIPPEMREDHGELDAAAAGQLPDLITLENMLGDMQLHTKFSDGKATVLEQAEAALAQGRQYMLVTDHSFSLGVVQGMKPEDIAKQRKEIDAANKKLKGRFTILQGAEVEIRADGTLDFDDETLSKLDIVLASMHTSLRQPRKQITERMLSAIRHPLVSIIGHPRGQLIPEREPADLDMDAVFATAKEHDVALEINANPKRLDLDDAHARRAIELGVKLTISTDSHQPDHFALMQYGVATARRAWVTAESVVNTWPLERVMKWVKGRQ